MTSSLRKFVERLVTLAAVYAALSPLIAFATDLPLPRKAAAPAPPPMPRVSAPYNWSGLYAGGHFGYLLGRTNVEDEGVLAERNAPTNGIVGGVMLGYNWQIEHAVLGLEGDFGWSNAHGVGTGGNDGGGTGGAGAGGGLTPVITRGPNSYDLRWTSHVRGRLGYAADNWLFFVAGGFAAADLNFQEGAVNTILVPAANGGKYYGWSVGGGVELAATRNAFARLEYLYDDFGHKDYVGVLGDTYRVSLTGHTLRAALGFKFDPLGR